MELKNMANTVLKRWHQLLCCLLIIPLLFSIVGCSNRGTGLSENEEYLRYFENDEIRGIVINSEYYLLPAPLHSFIDNRWAVQEEILEAEYVEDISDIYLPFQAYMELELTHGEMELQLMVVNHEENEINILDASVIEVEMRRVEKNQVVVIGGITGNTSLRDATEQLEALNIDFTDGQSAILTSSRGLEYRDELWISFHASDRVAMTFRLRVTPIGHLRSDFTRHRALSSEERLAIHQELEATFMQDASYVEGTFAGIYEWVFTDEDGETGSRHGTLLRIVDNNGDSVIINITDLTVDEERFLDLHLDDIIKVYFDPDTDGQVITLYDEEVAYIKAVVLVVNGDVYSRYRD